MPFYGGPCGKKGKSPSVNLPTPFLLVGWQAIIIANADPSYGKLVQRIKSIIFLATPHQGSDLAPFLNSVLFALGFTGLAQNRQYIAELERNCPTVQNINETFRHYIQGVRLSSFYESKPMRVPKPRMIVERDSAVLGVCFFAGSISHADLPRIFTREIIYA